MNSKAFGHRLRHLRDMRREWTQEQAAKETGAHPAAWSHWECGVHLPGCENLRDIQVGLRLTDREFTWLVTGQGSVRGGE